MSTLTISVEWSSSQGFSYHASAPAPHGGTLDWTFMDGDTIEFHNSTLHHDPSTSVLITGIHTVLGDSLHGLDSYACGSNQPFPLSSIVLPPVGSIVAYQWCQERPSTSPNVREDPKLGLANTADGGKAKFKSCSCSS